MPSVYARVMTYLDVAIDIALDHIDEEGISKGIEDTQEECHSLEKWFDLHGHEVVGILSALPRFTEGGEDLIEELEALGVGHDALLGDGLREAGGCGCQMGQATHGARRSRR